MDTHLDDSDLVPEIKKWNEGKGIDLQSWIECVGNYELASGYSRIFWPSFVRFESYVFREGGFTEEGLRDLEETMVGDRSAIEDLFNHIHIADIHMNVRSTEAQLRHLGRVLKEIHEVKLKKDFPDERFVVSFNDEDDLDLRDYQLTFYQHVER